MPRQSRHASPAGSWHEVSVEGRFGIVLSRLDGSTLQVGARSRSRFHMWNPHPVR